MSLITFLGDVALLNNKMKNSYKIDGNLVFNLEYVLTTNNSNPAKNKVILSEVPIVFKDFFGITPMAVSMANNHTMDYGVRGFYETKELLIEQKIEFFGAGSLEDNYNNPKIITVEEVSIAFLGYSLINDENKEDQGVAYFTEDRAIKDIAQAKSNADLIIVNIHWGVEEAPYHSGRQERVGKFLIDNGVDLVIGHHPHCIQPFEIYKGKYIFYSLGNCVFPNHSGPAFFNEDGKPERIFRKRLLKHNRLSYAVGFDIENRDVKFIDVLYFNERELYKIGNLNIGKKFHKTPEVINVFIRQMRKYLTFFISNTFVDGKLFDTQALLHEINMKLNKR